MTPSLRGALYGLTAAVLFGLSAPLAKRLLPKTQPVMLAGLLYAGAGLGLLAVGLLGRLRLGGRPRAGREAPLRRADLGYLAAIALTGGILGPTLMLTGLVRTSAVAGSLLLNLEAPFTIVLAVLAFGEHLTAREAGAAALILAGAALLAYRPGELAANPVGVLCLAGACLCWALDNNLTQRLSLRDPVALVRVKAVGAGAANLVLALAIGQRLPAWPLIGAALLLGLFSYGISVVLDTRALRLLGAARQAALFATAPFVGALAAIPILREPLRPVDLGAMGVMVLGVALLVRARHSHLHVHEELFHDHAHVHDEHHQHEHDAPLTDHELRYGHSHPHRHARLVHEHPHVSDLHHRHEH